MQDSQTGQIVGTTHKVERLFELIFLHLQSSRLSTSVVLGQSTSSLALWHSRLGHVSICDAPKPGGPLTTRQPAEYKWRSGYPTPL